MVPPTDTQSLVTKCFSLLLLLMMMMMLPNSYNGGQAEVGLNRETARYSPVELTGTTSSTSGNRKRSRQKRKSWHGHGFVAHRNDTEHSCTVLPYFWGCDSAISTFSPVGSLSSDGLRMSVCVCLCIALA